MFLCILPCYQGHRPIHGKMLLLQESIIGVRSNILEDINQNNQNGLRRRPGMETVVLNQITFVIWSKFS